jgi:8-oxo-dGTP diphosphatase
VSLDTATPYIASYVIVRNSGKIAFVLRSNTDWMNHHYGLPSGKVEKNESFSQAAIREAKEEIGITVLPENLKFIHISHRHDDNYDWVDVFFEATEWSGEPYNAEPHMHSELAWLDPKNLPDNVIPNIRYLIEQIESNKTYGEYGWDLPKD